MKILAVNSSDDMLSVALNLDGQIYAKYEQVARNHNRSVLVLIHQLLAEAGIGLNQIDGMAFGEGPGSFTGLRIAAGVAQGIAFGVDVPVIPVSCMAAIAQKQEPNKIVTALDAKRGKIFWASYIRDERGLASLQGVEKLTDITELGITGSEWYGAGSGWDMHAPVLLAQNEHCVVGWIANQIPQASEIAILAANYFERGLGKDAHLAIPRYMSGCQPSLTSSAV